MKTSKIKNLLVLGIAFVLMVPHTSHGYWGYGDSGAWVAPVVFGSILTGAAIAAANKPRTVVVKHQTDQSQQVQELQTQIDELTQQVTQLKQQQQEAAD
jgi:TolA-binding protein